MNYLKSNNIKLVECNTKPSFFIFTDPLYAIRKQIENKEYKLRRMRYLYNPIICGLNLNNDRLTALLVNTQYPITYYIPNIPINNKEDPIKFRIKEIYNNWVTIN